MAEFGGAQVGDARLSKRLVKLADRLSDAPSASIPGACNGHAETQGAYRLFDQAREDKRGLGWESVLAPHMARTQTRMAEHSVVLCLQDTTELDFNGQDIDGLGSLSYEAQRGMYVHPTYAATPERLPLGILDNWMWARPLDIAESRRWVEGYERLTERAGQLPATRLVYVADREADMLELMQRAHALAYPADYLLRAQHNRCLPRAANCGQRRWLLAEKASHKKIPSLREVIRRIAMLGGFLARKGDGEPGVKTLWQGFARVSSFVRGVQKMRAIHAL